jgi:phenylalanyl-tRNA synthetase beta chain
VAELDWDAISDRAFKKSIQYEEVSKFPIMRRDFALLIDQSVSFEAIRKKALEVERKILKEVVLFDVYEGKNLEKGKKSYGVNFTFQDKNKTLTDRQVDKVMEKLLKQFEKNFDAKLR